MGLTAQYYGNPGNFDRFYWVTPTFPNALGAPLGPAQVRGVDPLDNNNCVVVSWDDVPGAVSYAVSYSQSLETRDSSTFIVSTTSNSITDIGQTSNPVPSSPQLQGNIDAGSHDIKNVNTLWVTGKDAIALGPANSGPENFPSGITSCMPLIDDNGNLFFRVVYSDGSANDFPLGTPVPASNKDKTKKK